MESKSERQPDETHREQRTDRTHSMCFGEAVVCGALRTVAIASEATSLIIIIAFCVSGGTIPLLV